MPQETYGEGRVMEGLTLEIVEVAVDGPK